jgi:hypothetical protein
MLSFQGDREQDIAVVELGGAGLDRPLPFTAIGRRSPEIGDMVRFAGCQDTGALKDKEGYLLGWSMPQVEAKVVACVTDGFLIDYPVRKGMSGSGVFNSSGALVGLVVEHWSSALALHRVGVERPLGFCASALLLIPQYQKLRSEAETRAKSGELPWCGLPEQLAEL